MPTISSLIEEAGARAEAVPAFARELFANIEARIVELEATVKGLSTPAEPAPVAEPAKAAKAVHVVPTA